METPATLDAAEAATRLGVKRATLYAYVSRGLLRSARVPGTRDSRFDAADVAALARRRGGRAPQGGLEVVSTVTEIRDGCVFYRGRALDRLLRDGAPFERVAEWLWGLPEGTSPAWSAPAAPVRRVDALLRGLPDTTPLMDRLRVAAVAASSSDDLRHDLRPAAVAAKGAALIALFVRVAGSRPSGEGSVAHRLFAALSTRRATAAAVSALNAALVALADHDLAASTYAVRIAASVRADPYAAVGAGLGALSGALHGTASRQARALIAAAATQGASRAVGEALREGGPLTGFGHALYPEGDPRAALLLERVLELGAGHRLVRAIVEVRDLVVGHTGVRPNVDYALAALAEASGMKAEAGDAIFAVARTCGWLAHAMDEYAEPAVAFRYRPVARYVVTKITKTR